MKKELTFQSNQQTRYNSARAFLLVIVIASAVNLISVVLTETYFLFSAYLPQFLTAIGTSIYLETDVFLFYLIGAFLGACTIVPYLICYIFSKKHVGWMTAALVLFSVDTAMLLVDFVLSLMQGYLFGIADLIIHAIALVVLAMGVSSGKKAKQDEDAAPAFGAAPAATSDAYVPEGGESFAETRTLTLVRKKSFSGMAMPYACFVDGKQVCQIKNGESVTVEISGAPVTLGVMMLNGSASASVPVPAGEAPVTYEITTKTGMINAKITVTQVG